MTIVKTFTTRVEDRLGWDYAAAFVAVRYVSESSQTTYVSEDCVSNYEVALDAGVIAYSANFWGSKAMQLAGKTSRPISCEEYIEPKVIYEKDEDGEYTKDERGKMIPTGEVIEGYWGFTDVLIVDLDHLQSVQVLSSNMQPVDKVFRLIELDVSRRFAQ
jgi:hypothetical protein